MLKILETTSRGEALATEVLPYKVLGMECRT